MLSKASLGATASAAATDACILVVEDELRVRMHLCDQLRQVGYRVIEASNAEEAIDILSACVSVDLIISDVRMPGRLDGLGLLAFVRLVFPKLPMIITSGHLQPDATLFDGSTAFLRKPYNGNRMLGMLQDELARCRCARDRLERSAGKAAERRTSKREPRTPSSRVGPGGQ